MTNRQLAVLVCVVLGFATRLEAQTQTFTEKSLPATYLVTCDAPTTLVDGSPFDPAKQVLAMAVDGGAFSPDVPTCRFTLTITKPGDHPVAIVARYQQPDGTFKTGAPLTFTVAVTVTVEYIPTAPTNGRIAPLTTTVSPTSCLSASSLCTDSLGHTWALGANGDVLRDGVRVGGPATDLLLASGKVYALAGGSWWLWDETSAIRWTNVGATTPR